MKQLLPPIVSVVIPYYNLGDYLEETITSVLNQTYSNFEIILVNDGTTDPHSLEVLERVKQQYPRIQILNQRNRGLSAARNKGIKFSSGEYILPLDADDTLEPTFVEKCVWFLETHPHMAYVYTGVRHFGEVNAVCMDEFDFNLLKQNNFLTATVMFRKKHFSVIGGYKKHMKCGYEDWDFWLSMGERGYFGSLIPEPLFNYRRRAGSMLGDSLNQHERLVAEIKKRHRKLYGIASAKMSTEGTQIADVLTGINNVLDYFNRREYSYRRLLTNSTRSANSPRINVACILPWLEVGGADLVNLNIIQRIDCSKFNMSIITTLKSANRWYDKFYQLNKNIYCLAHFIPEERYLDFILYFIESRRIDIIFISNSVAGFNMLPYIKRYFPAVKVVDLQHMEEPSWWGGGFPKIGSYFDNCIDKHIVVSRYLKEYMVDNFHVSPHRIEVIHNGIDTRNTFDPDRYLPGEFRRELRLPDDIKIITIVGRLCDQKRPLTFVRLAEELVHVRGRHDLFFVIAGDGELRGATESLIRALGLDNYVRIMGYRNDACRILRDTDILVQPSLNEGLPIVALEAMAMKVPVLISNVGGIAELINGCNGVLIAAGEINLVAKYSEAVLDLVDNPIKRKEFGSHARETVLAKFDVVKMASEYEKLFTSLLRTM